MARILAIDYGTKRVGIAVSDELQLIASGLITVAEGELLPFLRDYISKESVGTLVIGEPKHLDNRPADIEEKILKLVKKLEKQFTEIPIHRVDERFTSKMAFQTMIDSGLKKKARQNKALIDEISATIILQSYMDSLQYKL